MAILSTSSKNHHDELLQHSYETQYVSGTLDFGKRLEVAHRKDIWPPVMPPCKTWRSDRSKCFCHGIVGTLIRCYLGSEDNNFMRAAQELIAFH